MYSINFVLQKCILYNGAAKYHKPAQGSNSTLFGGHRKGKRGWGAEGKSLVFGIYQRNGKVITFPVSDRKHDTLIPLIKLHTKKGSLVLYL